MEMHHSRELIGRLKVRYRDTGWVSEEEWSRFGKVKLSFQPRRHPLVRWLLPTCTYLLEALLLKSKAALVSGGSDCRSVLRRRRCFWGAPGQSICGWRPSKSSLETDGSTGEATIQMAHTHLTLRSWQTGSAHPDCLQHLQTPLGKHTFVHYLQKWY